MISMICSILSGICFFNAIPHLVQGICGKKHMTPLSPQSSALVNVIWGWINIICGLFFLLWSQCYTWQTIHWILFCLGAIGISIFLAIFWSNPNARLPWHRD